MTSKNQERRLRRKSKDAKSSQKRGMAQKREQKPIQLNEAESMLMNNINAVGGIATTNQQNVIEINKTLNALNNRINSIDKQMTDYDVQIVQPNFAHHEKKIDLLIDLIIDNVENINLTDEQMSLLGIEVEPLEDQIPKPPVEKEKDKKVGRPRKEEIQNVETNESK